MAKITTFVVFTGTMYAKSMAILSKVTAAPKPRTGDSLKIAYAYAFILAIFALCQLFTFEKFIPLLNGFKLPGGMSTANLIGSLLVVSEVFSLAFLLRLKLSDFMRTICMCLSWLVPAIWLFLSLWLVFTPNNVDNIGFLGTLVKVLPGWWTVLISVELGIMAAWASWGLWPFRNK